MAKGTRKLEIIITASARAATRVFNKLKTGMRSVVSAGAKVGLGIASGFAAAGAVLTAISVKVLNLADDLGKTADRLGVTTEELSAFRHQMELAGASTKEADTIMKFMQRSLSDAAEGTGEATAALEKLGLNAEELKSQAPTVALENITRALEGVESSADKTAIAMDIFGRSGDRILNTTADAFGEARKEAEMFGIAMSRQDAKQMENINDSITRVKAAITGASIQLIKQFSPAMEAIGEKLAEWSASGALSKWAKDLGVFIVNILPKALIALLNIMGHVAMGFRGWQLLWGELQIGFLSFSESIWSGLNTIRNGVTSFLDAVNIGGVFDEALANSKRIAGEQQTILSQLSKDKQQAIKDQNETIQNNQKERDTIDKLKKQVDDFAKSIQNETAQTDKQIESVNKIAQAYDKATTSKQAFVSLGSPQNTGQRIFGDANLLTNLDRTEGG
jgi:hypothetical protein